MSEANKSLTPEGATGQGEQAKTMAIICYGLSIAGVFIGITGIISVILAYIKRGDAIGTPYYDHYCNIITVFWVGVVMMIVSFVTAFILIGYAIGLLSVIWVLYRLIKGLVKILDGKSYQ